MYRRLVTFALVVVTVALVSLVIPLGLAARDLVQDQGISEISDQARGLADDWEAAWWRGDKPSWTDAAPARDDARVSLISPGGTVLGEPVDDAAATVVASARSGRSATQRVGGLAFAAAPVFFDNQVGVVLITADAAELREGLGRRLVALAAVSVAMLAASAVAAWQLARRTARPIRELAITADRLAAGDLEARAGPSDIPEVAEVGVALNRLAHRVQELLATERAATAELAHQLRTPLTVLTGDIDAVADDDVRARLTEDALALQRTTDEIITSAGRPAREGLRPTCDAVAVGRRRAEFWEVLADYQQRALALDVANGPLLVRLTEDDLATAADILLQNVFVHTPEGTDFTVRIQPAAAQAQAPAGDRSASGLVELSVLDSGPGFGDVSGNRPGSTQLGLSIAQRLATASGGWLQQGESPTGGAAVTMYLGRAPD